MKRKAARRMPGITVAIRLILLTWLGACVLAGGIVQAQGISFTSPTPVGRSFTPASRIVLADFNADGNADLATVGYINGDTSNNNNIYLQIYLGNGQGSFVTTPSTYVNVNFCDGVKGLASLGLDSDGSLNLVLLCSTNLQIWHVKYDASSTSTPIRLINNGENRQVVLLNTASVAMTVTDLFGTGGAGIAVLEAGADYFNRSVEYFGPGDSCSGSCNLQILNSTPVMTDISGLVDPSERGKGIVAVPQPGSSTPALVIATMIVGNCGGSIVSLLPQPDGTSFVTGEVLPIPAGLCTSAVATGNYSAEGNAALILSGTYLNGPANTGFLAAYTGSSDGTFGGPDLHTDNVHPPVDDNGLSMLDLNGDGNADIVVAGPYGQGISGPGDTVSIYLGNGDGTFTFSQAAGPSVNTGSADLGTGMAAVTSGNINTDGAPDLATIDLVGDGSGGGVGNVQQLAGSIVQVFPPRSGTTTISLTATDTSNSIGGFERGPKRITPKQASLGKSGARPKPAYYGPQITTQLSATVLPNDATGWVQFFDATTQTWIGSAQLSFGEADLTVYGDSGHRFIASYYGSSSYVGSNSSAVKSIAAKSVPYVYLDIEPNMAAPGDTVTLDASIYGNAGSPTGAVNFVDLNSNSIIATASLNGGNDAIATLSNLPVGNYDIIASYLGDGAYKPASSVDIPLTIAVALIPDAITLTATPTTLNVGESVNAIATLSSSGNASPVGSVLFQLDGVTVATSTISSGTASATFTATAAGNHRLQAIYAGDGISAPANSTTVLLTVHGGLVQFLPDAANIVAGIPATDTTGAFGGDGGPATLARLYTPFGLAYDGGNLYIADEQNNIIRKVTPDGTISTVAGLQYVGNIYSTRYSGDGGPATSAYLSNPSAVVFNHAGDMFIADYSNNVIRRVDAITGIISTYAGNNNGSTSDSSPATSIRLNNPIALAIDTADKLYIADSRNNLIRKVDTSGMMTTVAGHYGYYGAPTYGQLATNSVLNHPQGVAVDTVGNLYIADTSNGVVSKVDTNGIITRFAGGSTSYVTNFGDGGPATGATLNLPTQLALNAAGELYITDPGNGVIRRVDVNGIITTVAGYSYSSGGNLYDPAGTAATSAPLSAPSGIAIDTVGNLLISDTGDQTVWRVGPAGAVVFGPQAAGTTSAPQFITLENVGDSAVTFNATPFAVTGDYLVTSEGTSPCNFTAGLAVGASCTIAIRYRPSLNGALNGNVVFSTVNSGTPTITLLTRLTFTPATVALQLSSNTLELGQDLLAFASISPAPSLPQPTGTLSFFDGSTSLGTAPLVASSGFAYGYIDTTTLALGGHDITATYSGDNLYASSTTPSQHVDITKILTSVSLAVDNSTPSMAQRSTSPRP
jgi:hypothetical protein